jgi:hypothetical protein
MPHQVACPVCGVPMKLPDDSPGRGFQCIRCGAALVTGAGGQLATQPRPMPPANPFADSPGGFAYPAGFSPGPFAPGFYPPLLSREAALAKVYGPGLMLQIAGGLIVLAALCVPLLLLIPDAPDPDALLIGVLVGLTGGLALGAFTFYCGSQLKALRSYVLVLVSVVFLLGLGLLACPLLALPGIWPLIVLLDTGVKAHFGTR